MKDSGVPWIGKIPLSLKLIRNKYLLSYEKGKKADNTNVEQEGVPYIGASDLDSCDTAKLYTTDTALPDVIYDDVLVLWDGARAGLVGTNKVGKLSSTVVKLTPDENVVSKHFLYWYYMAFQQFMYDMVNGTTIPHMSRRFLEDIGFLSWSLDEQNRISNYLDTKCTQIDTIIDNEQSVIEKLQEYKKAIITETIIKGLNDSVERQNPGAVWFLGVPISWTFSELRYVTRDIFDIDHWMPESQDEGIPYLMTGDLESRTSYIDFSKTKKISIEDFNRLARNKYPCYHDIIMARYASIGNCTYVDTSNQFLVSYSCLTIRPNIDEILPMFMYYYFKSYAFEEECKVYIKLNTQGNIGKDNLRRIKLVYPNIGEQALIVKYLDTKCANIDAVILKKHSLIDKLTEYKKSLIYEVVTGKKEVPHV